MHARVANKFWAIAQRGHRKLKRGYDRIAFKQRWDVEGIFAELKQWLRIVIRCDKLSVNFFGFIILPNIMLRRK